MSIASDYPYLRQRLAEEEAARAAHGRHDSAATIRANSDIPKSELVALPVATKENDWLGFCPSAVKLQNGHKKEALRKRTDYGAAFAASGVTTYYCSQKGCHYAGHQSVETVWKTVMKDERLGLKCRWAFLAKSHVKQGPVQGRMYEFQCPICIFSYGHAEGRIWRGVPIFMEHVCSHRGRDIPFEVMQKLALINDHVADDKDDFDINLYPLQYKSESETSSIKTQAPATGAGEGKPHAPSLLRSGTRTSIVDSLWSRKASTATTAALKEKESVMEGPSGFLHRTSTWRSDLSRTDSVVEGAGIEEENEGPWSEGLSQFKVDREEDYLSPDF